MEPMFKRPIAVAAATPNRLAPFLFRVTPPRMEPIAMALQPIRLLSILPPAAIRNQQTKGVARLLSLKAAVQFF